MKGYLIDTGYKGYVPDYNRQRGYMEFSTDKEYEEYYKENYEEKDVLVSETN